eukprot:5671777-Alexandrium_andersonii.AAC.1
MSASLVGSEMCIRDSCLVVNSADSSLISSASFRSSGLAGLSAPQREPVSYTHLTLPTICSV